MVMTNLSGILRFDSEFEQLAGQGCSVVVSDPFGLDK